jgi:cation transport regulator ChaB
MPKTTKSGKPIADELPAPVARSDAHAQATFAKAHDSALTVDGHGGGDEPDDEQYAYRVAYSALKHTYEKVGDHWERKAEAGPSDPRSESGGAHPSGESYGGVDENASKQHLLDVARRLEVRGRSRMTKSELAEAIDKANQKANAKARS